MKTKNIVIVGKNSRLFKEVLLEGSNFFNSVVLLSSNDKFDACRDAIVILISVSKYCDSDNIRIAESIRLMTPAKVILISSMSVLAAKRHLYVYPRIKYNQERVIVSSFSHFVIVRLGTVLYSSTDIREPNLYCFKESVIHALELSLREDSNCIYECYSANENNFQKIHLYGRILMLFSGFSIIFRPIDYLLSKMSRYTYGYSLLSYMYARRNVL